MSEFYGLQNLPAGSAGASLAGVAYSAGSVSTLSGVGTDATAADLVYELPFVAGGGTIRSFSCVIVVAPTAVAPILKFWRRPIAGLSLEAACIAMTPATMTLSLTSPTIIAGNVYRTFFTAGNSFAQGESFIVEADTLDSGVAATILCGVTGNFDAPVATEVVGTGIAKHTPSAVGRIYTKTS